MSAFRQRRAQLEQPECEACGSIELVIDTKEGQLVCTDCGVIARQSMISNASEYRNFSESDKPQGACRNAVESAVHALIDRCHGMTYLSLRRFLAPSMYDLAIHRDCL